MAVAEESPPGWIIAASSSSSSSSLLPPQDPKPPYSSPMKMGYEIFLSFFFFLEGLWLFYAANIFKMNSLADRRTIVQLRILTSSDTLHGVLSKRVIFPSWPMLK